MPPKDLTLIVAATHALGIGKNNALPWPMLKQEMAYFARVTKRVMDTSPGKRNAVIMGRKTWDSIPPKFRPLKDRLNIVLSRSYPSSPPSNPPSSPDGPLQLSSLTTALSHLNTTLEAEIDRIFVIGGAEIYGEALKLKEARRLLLTRVEGEWECDVFLKVELEGWRRVEREEMGEWIGEGVEGGVREEKGVRYEFLMFERD